MGAQGIDEWRSNNPGGTSSFAGVGQSLDGSSSVGQPIAPPPQEHTITFWANGFSVDDGPLRNAQDPANAAFLADVNRGAALSHPRAHPCLLRLRVKGPRPRLIPFLRCFVKLQTLPHATRRRRANAC